MKTQLTAERLREVLSYDPLTGRFTWIVQKRGQPFGAMAGTVNSSGYVVIEIDDKLYLAHRLAWLHVTGNWPPNRIDHQNRIKSDNRWTNLRDATPSQNAGNSGVCINNKSGIKGVCFVASTGKWQAQIKVFGKQTYLGQYEHIEDARDAYTSAARKHFGEFARVA
jgi:hypothetical protein